MLRKEIKKVKKKIILDTKTVGNFLLTHKTSKKKYEVIEMLDKRTSAIIIML